MTAGSYSRAARPLTPRMLAVLAAASRGLTARQTAAELNVSEATVWTERAALCARAGVPNVTAAAFRYGRGDLA